MTSVLISSLPTVSDDRNSHESLWECHAAGSDLGTDGVGGEDTPVLHSSPELLVVVETNGINERTAGVLNLSQDRATLELGEGRSPVEEAGHEVEAVEDEELGSTVEEGEEAALALGVMSTESDFSWLPVKQASVDHSDEGVQPQDSGSSNLPEYVETSVLVPTEVSSMREWDVHCGSVQ